MATSPHGYISFDPSILGNHPGFSRLCPSAMGFGIPPNSDALTKTLPGAVVGHIVHIGLPHELQNRRCTALISSAKW